MIPSIHYTLDNFDEANIWDNFWDESKYWKSQPHLTNMRRINSMKITYLKLLNFEPVKMENQSIIWSSPFYFFSVIFDGNMFQTTKQIALDQLLATNTNFCIINIAAELKKK